MGERSLQLQQLDRKMLGFVPLTQVVIPPTGWVKAIRTAIGMSMQQLGNKLNVSKQGVMDMNDSTLLFTSSFVECFLEGAAGWSTSDNL